MVFPDGRITSDKGLVCHDPEGLRGADEGIAGNAGGRLIGLAEAAVDDDQLAAALDGAFTLAGFDRHMAVDDVAVRTLKTEFLQNELADGGVLIERVIRVLRLRPGLFVGDEAAFEGGHAIPAEDRAVAPGPEEPEQVHAQLALGRAGFVVIGLARRGIGKVEEVLSGALGTVELEREQLSVRREGNAAVKEQVAVMDLIEASLGIEKADMLLQLFAVLERTGQTADDLCFLRG